MKKIISLSGLAITMLLAISIQLQAETKVVICSKIETPPVIDGSLSDACWKEIVPVTNFLDERTQIKAKVQTKVYLCYDNKNLYVGYELDEPKMSHIKALCSKHDGYVWRDDDIEIFLDTDFDRFSYFQFIANSIGTKFEGIKSADAASCDKFWDGKWQVETSKGEDTWFAETAIPFKSLDLTTPGKGTIWGIGLGRERYAGGKEANSFPANIFHKPENFASLTFGTYLDQIKLELISLDKDLNRLSRIWAGEKKELISLKREISKFFKGITKKESLTKEEWLSLQKEISIFKRKSLRFLGALLCQLQANFEQSENVL